MSSINMEAKYEISKEEMIREYFGQKRGKDK